MPLEIETERFNLFIESFKQENDRGAALAAAAFIEEILDKILTSFLADVPSTKDLIKGFAAPIRSVAAKSKLAYSLGLLDSELFASINIVRKIRNEFAHQWIATTFDVKRIQSLVNSLPTPPLSASWNSIGFATIRQKFDNYASFLLLELSVIPHFIRSEKRLPRRIVNFEQFQNSEDETKNENENL